MITTKLWVSSFFPSTVYGIGFPEKKKEKKENMRVHDAQYCENNTEIFCNLQIVQREESKIITLKNCYLILILGKMCDLKVCCET